MAKNLMPHVFYCYNFLYRNSTKGGALDFKTLTSSWSRLQPGVEGGLAFHNKNAGLESSVMVKFTRDWPQFLDQLVYFHEFFKYCMFLTSEFLSLLTFHVKKAQLWVLG